MARTVRWIVWTDVSIGNLQAVQATADTSDISAADVDEVYFATQRSYSDCVTIFSSLYSRMSRPPRATIRGIKSFTSRNRHSDLNCIAIAVMSSEIVGARMQGSSATSRWKSALDTFISRSTFSFAEIDLHEHDQLF